MTKRTEQIRIGIMDQLYGYRPGTRSAEQLALYMRREQDVPDATEKEIAKECDYLVQRGFAASAPYELAQGGKRFEITASGIDWMEREGLV